MPLLTEEELALLDPAKRQAILDAERKIAEADEKLRDYDSLKKLDNEFKGLVQKANTDPKALKAMKDLFELTGLKVDVPDPPFAKFMEPLKEENKALKERLSKIETRDLKEKLTAKFEELGIPNTKETWDKIDEIIKTKGIGDYFTALEFYAATREPEVPSVEYSRPFDFSANIPDEKMAMANSLKEIRELKKQTLRR